MTTRMRTLLQLSIMLLAASLPLGVAVIGLSATVVKDHVSRQADLVELDVGSEAGLRLGMRGTVVRKSVTIATLIVVELRSSASIALIEVLSPDVSLHTGDQVLINSARFLSK